MRELLRDGAPVDGVRAHTKGAPLPVFAPIFYAAQNSQIEAIVLLIESGADIGASYPAMLNPLAGGILSDNPAVVRELIKRGAPLRTDRLDALMYAINRDRSGVISELLLARANQDPRTISDDAVDPLAYAVELRRVSVIRAMLSAGVSPNGMATDQDRTRPVDLAASLGCQSIVRVLVDAGADTDRLFKRSQDGLTASEVATQNGWVELAAYLNSLPRK
jgi:ankyrin repeat protein